MASVTAAWTTIGQWRGLKHYSALKWAYRSPALFLSTVSEHQIASTEILRLDEGLCGQDIAVELSAGAHELFYLCSHGETTSDRYRAVLDGSDWDLDTMGGGAQVVVCDTCDLVDLSSGAWEAGLLAQLAGARTQLLLGFASKATISRSTSERGRLFAEYIARGDAVAEAWIDAVHDVTPRAGLDSDRPIAIALGDTRAEASEVLGLSWPELLVNGRSGAQTFIEYLGGA